MQPDDATMHASWTYRLRFLKKHLLMFLMAIGWVLIQSQVAVASHDCSLSPQGESAMLQHMDMMVKTTPHHVSDISPLCEKHCVPDQAQKETPHAQLVALPVAMTLAVNPPECRVSAQSAWSLTPPAAGPPATIRFCRFRE